MTKAQQVMEKISGIEPEVKAVGVAKKEISNFISWNHPNKGITKSMPSDSRLLTGDPRVIEGKQGRKVFTS